MFNVCLRSLEPFFPRENTEKYYKPFTLVAVIFVQDVCIFVVFDFVLVHFYDPPVSFIFENSRLDHFVVDIVDSGHTFHCYHFPVTEI